MSSWKIFNWLGPSTQPQAGSQVRSGNIFLICVLNEEWEFARQHSCSVFVHLGGMFFLIRLRAQQRGITCATTAEIFTGGSGRWLKF